MKFDIVKFLDKHNVHWTDKGSNVKRGNINVACPFCKDDPSEHLGISLETGYWCCWRDQKNHKGKRLHRLLIALTGISYVEADAQLSSKAIEASDIESIATGKFFQEDEPRKKRKKKRGMKLPKEFMPINVQYRSGRVYRDYLAERSMALPNALWKRYYLHYCSIGEWRKRIILPVHLYGELVTWTARAVNLDTDLRYKSLGNEEGTLPIKHTIYNFDNAMEEVDTNPLQQPVRHPGLGIRIEILVGISALRKVEVVSNPTTIFVNLPDHLPLFTCATNIQPQPHGKSGK